MFEDSKAMFLSSTEGREPAEGLANFLDYYLSARHRDEVAHGCPLPRLSGELARLPLPARERFAAGAARLTGQIAGLLGKLGIAEPEPTATAVVSEAVGALAMARAVPDRERSDRILEASRMSIKARLGLN
jgi:TetR/AcrR family transcriptional repressor of nem operon